MTDENRLDDLEIELTKSAPYLQNAIYESLDKLEKSTGMKPEAQIQRELAILLSTIDQFQIGPHFLDSILENMMRRLTKYPVNEENPVNWPFHVIYALCKVRGYKTISRFLPVDVYLLEDVVLSLENSDHSSWQRKYCLLLWLSMLILVPFNFKQTLGDDFTEKVFRLAINQLKSSGKERDAAALVICRIVTRPDTKDIYLEKFFLWCKDIWGRREQSSFFRLGLLQATSHILLLTDYENIHKYDSGFLEYLMQLCHEKVGTAVQRKYIVKCISRFGLLSATHQDEHMELVEDVMIQLLSSLEDDNTVVRYSASKNVARLVEKLLDPELQEQVISSVLDNFDQNYITEKGGSGRDMQVVNANVWHGSLLCIAELLRRKLINLSAHVPLLCDKILPYGLSFEQRQISNYSSGSNVRDASCYVCWALFRGYKDLSKDVIQSILNILVCNTCYDREVTIRRAAGAAIQEAIGRHSQKFENIGERIELVTAVDFFKLGLRTTSFLDVSKHLYELGFHNIIEYATRFPLLSVYSGVRRLAAQSIGEIIQKFDGREKGYPLAEICARTILKTEETYGSSDLDIEHGVCYGLGSILKAIDAPLNKETMDKILSMLENKFTEKDLSGVNEMIYSDMFAFLYSGYVKFASASNTDILFSLALNKLPLCVVRQPGGKMRLSVKSMTDEMYVADGVMCAFKHFPAAFWTSEFTKKWLDMMFAGHELAAKALGSIENLRDIPNGDFIMEGLEAIIKRQGKGKKTDVLTRVQATKVLGHSLLSSKEHNVSSFMLFLLGLDDTTVSKTAGEVGYFARVQAIQTLSEVWTENKERWQSDEEAKKLKTVFISRLLKLSFDIIDRVRLTAATTLCQLFPEILGPEFSTEKQTEIIESQGRSQAEEQKVYFQFLMSIWPYLKLEPYKRWYAFGLVKMCGSVQGVTATLEAASECLTSYLNDKKDGYQELKKWLLYYLKSKLRSNNSGAQRMSNSSLVLWEKLLKNDIWSELESSEKIDLVMAFDNLYNVAESTHIKLLILSCLDLCLFWNDLTESVWRLIMKMLNDQSSEVRSQAASMIFDFVIKAEVSDDRQEDLMEKMDEIDWNTADQSDVDIVQTSLLDYMKNVQLE